MTGASEVLARCAPGDERARAWLAAMSDHCVVQTERVALECVDRWSGHESAEQIRHDLGAFFSVIGVRVKPHGPDEPGWDQPIIHQPERGILGILVREQGGVLSCLMQAKAEPGTIGGAQLAPTVQATQSNYTRRHGGSEVPYLDAFLGGSGRVWFDVLQSEQGSRFHGKQNRNIVVAVGADTVPAIDGFAWFTLGELYQALGSGDLLNFDARTVLAGLVARVQDVDQALPEAALDDFTSTLLRSLSCDAGSRHSVADLLGWVHSARKRPVVITAVPLQALEGWGREAGALTHHTGGFFDVIGVRAVARGREVATWSQPMIAEHGTGLMALLVSTFDDALHVLMDLRMEPGLARGWELAPTVQCTPGNYAAAPWLVRPLHLDLVLEADPRSVRFDSVLSAEGGRFYRAEQRHLIVETQDRSEPPGFRWVSAYQLAELVRRGGLVNEQARSLFACLVSLSRPRDDARSR